MTVSVAVALDPDAVKLAEPRFLFPRVKVTVPVGAIVPVTGVTVAVRTGEALALELVETVVVVATGAVTVTVVVAVEPVKLELPL